MFPVMFDAQPGSHGTKAKMSTYPRQSTHESAAWLGRMILGRGRRHIGAMKMQEPLMSTFVSPHDAVHSMLSAMLDHELASDEANILDSSFPLCFRSNNLDLAGRIHHSCARWTPRRL